MSRISGLIATLLLTAATAAAEPYWIEWTGDTFPETEGWTRFSSDPPAERWLEDGKLFIDSRADWFITEEYWYPRPGMMTLEEGETFVYRWRVKVDEVIVELDPGAGLRTDDQREVVFALGEDRIISFYEPDKYASFAPGEWHEFLFESSDMQTYSLYMDSELAWEGTFFDSLFSGAGVSWGDTWSHRSLSEWDHVEFGILPEPVPALSVLLLCLLWLPRRSAAPDVRSAHRRPLTVRRTPS